LIDLVNWTKEPESIFRAGDSRINGKRAFPDCVLRARYPHNPVFKTTGNKKDFDGIFLQHPCPVLVDSRWRLYYNGWTLNPGAKSSLKA